MTYARRTTRPSNKTTYHEKYSAAHGSEVRIGNNRTNPPAVTGLKYEQVAGDKAIYGPMSKHLYKVPGTDKYIDICEGKVRTDTMNCGNIRTKIIWKHPKFWQVDTKGHIDFATTLCDLTKKWYIAIDVNEQITGQREPVWFNMIKTGSSIRFQFRKLYLAYNLRSNRLQAQGVGYLFDELPAPSLDSLDGSASQQEMVQQVSRRWFSKSAGHGSASQQDMVQQIKW